MQQQRVNSAGALTGLLSYPVVGQTEVIRVEPISTDKS